MNNVGENTCSHEPCDDKAAADGVVSRCLTGNEKSVYFVPFLKQKVLTKQMGGKNKLSDK